MEIERETKAGEGSERYRKGEGQTQRLAGKQTDRQTDIQTDKQTDRKSQGGVEGGGNREGDKGKRRE